jgi:N-acetylneuraminic acid mutarotase
MSQKLTLLLLLFHLALNGQTWTEKASLPSPAIGRHHPITFTLNGKGYFLGGSSTTQGYLRDFYRYDATLDSWTKLPDAPGPDRGFSYGVEYQGKAYIGFGYGNGNAVLNDLWEYDPVQEKWTELTSCPCDGRGHPAFVAANNQIYVGLGGNQLGNLSDFWAYDISKNSWKKIKSLPGNPRHHPFYFNIGNDVYAGLGHGSIAVAGSTIYRDFYRYDHVTDQWTRLKDHPGEARVAGTQFSHNGKGYVLHGQGRTHDFLPTAEFWEYTPATDSWKALPPAPGVGRWAPGSFVIGNNVYTLGGSISGAMGEYVDMKDNWTFPIPGSSGTDQLLENELAIWPNPAAGRIFVADEELSLSGDGKNAEIISMDGRLCLTDENFTDGIDIQTLKPGIYLLKIQTGAEVRTGKFVKQ